MQPLRTVDVQLQVNGQDHALRLTSAATLLHVLRNDLGLNSPKFGCGRGQCGACTVVLGELRGALDPAAKAAAGSAGGEELLQLWQRAQGVAVA